MFADAIKKSEFPGAQVVGSVWQFLTNVFEAFAAGRKAYGIYHELSRLSDQQLAARGLTRGDVTRLTLEALPAD